VVYQLLTDRQGEFLRLHCEGKSNVEIASLMNVSVPTVQGMRSNILNRLRQPSLAAVCALVETGEAPSPVLRKPTPPSEPVERKRKAPRPPDKPLWRRYPTGE
jgi:DNA-binding CsgD family transcriptional regulator